MSAKLDQFRALLHSAATRERTLTIVERQVLRTAQVIEERIELLDRAGRIIRGGEGAKVLRNARRRLCAVRQASVDRNDVRDHKMFERGETDFNLQHVGSFLRDYGTRPILPAHPGHRLSGDAK